MQFNKIALAATVAATTVSAEGYTPGNPWSTLTPTATYSCGVAQFTSSFGIAVKEIASTSAAKAKRDVVSQIGDGQIQAVATTTLKPTTTTTTSKTSTTSTSSASKTSSSASSCAASATVTPKDSSCKNSGTLQLTLEDGVLTDAKGRIGAIVSNRQFQFDGPPPQAGSIYAAGWTITEEGNLALGDSDVFYQCLSGNFYNLYDQNIAEQCTPINLEVVSLVDC
ncbi:uncharacterized protein NDAI_0B00170 [Naumovozyma dairenensis CBS 421]|uniref:Cell wall mannoprotein PIR1-like C-terminal domain-containing protein n=1 Tax=Naumovozyma dairenensis (strain ATCC 10597 / BCRC 20456 / CBS 421 / NBRC 0211 / NRRL Y-12639) TaxID=1071378 RepID=G0W5J0_NAUDC|nr:hypothetical protein NDAI_0B00170 [Naumovozyma dairenensis CBS 421]CCD23051.1 hypothetical protein NDAI_0B00170 [Naumovozyma dairenensis CBS 421]